MSRDGWEKRKDAWVRESDRATIHKVSPRGETLYAVRLPGAKRPEWCATLAAAKDYARRVTA